MDMSHCDYSHPNDAQFSEVDKAWYKHEVAALELREQLEDLGWTFWGND